MTDCDPVGITDIAGRLGVAATTPHQWKSRGLLPAHDYTVSGTPAWDWRTVLRWAGLNGRIYRPEALAEYVAAFGEEPARPRMGGPGNGVVPDPVKPRPRKRNASIGRSR